MEYLGCEKVLWLKDGIDPEEMSRDEREWLNNYHKDVYEKIGPHLTAEEQAWLKEYTRPI